MLIICVTFTIKPDVVAAFRDAILANAATSLAAEPGCDLFDVCEGADGVFFLYERYLDDAAFELHLQSKHFIDFDRLVAPWVQAKDVKRYALVSPLT